jgi:hypothetical protein
MNRVAAASVKFFTEGRRFLVWAAEKSQKSLQITGRRLLPNPRHSGSRLKSQNNVNVVRMLRPLAAVQVGGWEGFAHSGFRGRLSRRCSL